MELTAKEARDVVEGGSEQWEAVTGTEKVVTKLRWSVVYAAVFIHLNTQKTYRFEWNVAASECQDERPYEYVKTYKPIEVVLKEITVWNWVPVDV